MYALSLGCDWAESRYVYENDNDFGVLPTFGVLPLHNGALESLDVSGLVPNYNPMNVLHGEHFLELKQPFPTSGELRTTIRVIDVLDKGKAAVIILGTSTYNAVTGDLIAENEITTYIRGSGGFGKTEPRTRRAEAAKNFAIPLRPPDKVVEEQTNIDLAALYRLNGDPNPLHIDREFAAIAGFPQPILHGLCTFGIAAKHVLKTYAGGHPGKFKSIKGRFAKHVFPGETLRTEMWQTDEGQIIFQVKVMERDVVAISEAAVKLKLDHSVAKL